MNDDSYVVYMHTAPNGKRYVGITGQLPEERWRKNGKGYKTQIFGRAVKKYGWENIKHTIVSKDLTKDDAGLIEQVLIRLFMTNDPRYGYNISIGGSAGPLGVKRSAETIEKLRLSHIGKRTSLGRHLSEEQKERLRIANIGKTLPREVRKKISEKNKKRRPTEYATRRAIEVCSKPVIQLSTGRIFQSATQASKESGEPLNTITNHCRNEIKKIRWQYVKKS